MRQMAKWMLVLSPFGAARQASVALARELAGLLPGDSLHTFDSKRYVASYTSLVKREDQDTIVDLTNQSLIVSCMEHEITHLLVMALSPVTLFSLQLLKRRGITTVHWFIEDHRTVDYWQDVLPGYDWFLAIQKGPVPEKCRANSCHYVYLPVAADPACIQATGDATPNERRADAAFIGFPSPYRISVLEHLAAGGVSLAIAGHGWQLYSGPLSSAIESTDWVMPSGAAAIMRRSAITINLSKHEPPEDRSDVHLSPRVFDALAAGAVLLTEDVPLLHATIGNLHYHTFRDREEAVTRIAALPGEPSADERASLEMNRAGIMAHHMWRNRAEEILEKCG